MFDSELRCYKPHSLAMYGMMACCMKCRFCVQNQDCSKVVQCGVGGEGTARNTSDLLRVRWWIGFCLFQVHKPFTVAIFLIYLLNFVQTPFLIQSYNPQFEKLGTGLERWLRGCRVFTALAEDQRRPCHPAHRCCNSDSKGSDALFWRPSPPISTHAHARICAHT